VITNPKELQTTDYMVRFKAHFASITRPEGWPEFLPHDCFWRVKDFATLKTLTDNEYGTFIQRQGVVVIRKEKKPLGEDIETLDLRIFIPMHMISYIDAETRIIVGGVPDMTGDGSEGDGEGVRFQ